jgi:DNA-binding MarR family transcriptional regulator
MSSLQQTDNGAPPLAIGALLRFLLHDVRARIYEGVVAAGFDDLRPAHVTLFRWPGPDGRRPTEVAADAQITKQAVNDLLRHLEKRGYLELRPDPSDNRARLIRLTARGKRLHKLAVGIHSDVEDEWAQAIGRREFAMLREKLGQLVDRRVSQPAR